MMKLNKTRPYIDKVLNSTTFKKSKTNSTLLLFLYESYTNKLDLKEQIIGINLYQKDYSKDKEDSSVRVYIRNLRIKLEDYYKGEGKDDEIIFKIEKGQYNLTFENKIKEIPSLKINNKTVIASIITLFIIFSLVGTSFISTNKMFVWDTLFSSDSETICLVSDAFVYRKQKSVNEPISIVRSLNINNKDEFYKYKQPEDSMVNFNYYPKASVLGTKILSQWFTKNNTDYSLYNESDFKTDLTKNNNIIILGNAKTQRIGRNLVLHNNSKLNFLFNGFTLQKKDTLITYESNLKSTNTKSVDYALLSYQKLANNNRLLAIYSHNDIGMLKTLKNLINIDWLNDFKKTNNLTNDSEFNVLFKVTGFKRTAIDAEQIYIELF
ncbi:hypothetical protein N9901_01515 [Flavobacteriaceae bacterium]|nr:hypothetical protein [Flavobacteriaceae bacterium]